MVAMGGSARLLRAEAAVAAAVAAALRNLQLRQDLLPLRQCE